MFPTDPPSIPPFCEIILAIDLKPGTPTISVEPYHMAPVKLTELNS